MGQEIVYCHRCQTRLLGSDFDRGKAFRINQNATCAECAKKILDELPPAEREAVMGRSKGPEPKKGSTGKIPAYKATTDSSHNRIKAVTTRSAAPPLRKSSSAAPLVLGIGAVVLVGLIGMAALVSGGSRRAPVAAPPPTTPPAPAPAPPPAPVRPAPAPPRKLQPRTASLDQRLKDAKRFLAEARAFATESPQRLPEQVDLFQKAALAAEGTPISGEALTAFNDAKKRLRNSFAKDLADLRAKALASAKAGDFAAAMERIDESRSRFSVAGLTIELHALTKEVESLADIAYGPLKNKALDLVRNGDRAGAEKILESLKAWQIRRLFEDLERALATPAKTSDATPAAAKPKLDLVIYDDTLAPGWVNHSWASDVDLSVEKPVHTGSKAISFTPRAKWAGLLLRARKSISTAFYPAVTFAARRGDDSVHFQLVLYDEQGKVIAKHVSLKNLGGQPPTDRWRIYTVPVARLGATGRLVSAVVLQAHRPSEKPALFVDDVGFLSKLPAGAAAAAPDTGPATGYAAEFKKAMAFASVRDFKSAADVLEKAGKDAEKDLTDLRAAAALRAAARETLENWPRGRNLDVLYANATGLAVRIDEPVRWSDGYRAVLRGGTVVPFGEISSGSLAAIALRGKQEPSEQERRAATVLSLLDGDVTAAGAIMKSLPSAFLKHAESVVQRRVSDEKELAARKLLYEAEHDYQDYSTRVAALDKYKTLVAEYVNTDVVRRNRGAIDARTEGGREYFFGLRDLNGNATCRIREHEKGMTAWTCAKDVLDPAERLASYVEFDFSALPSVAYRAWAYVGACCAETFVFHLQASELEGRDPNQPGVIISAEPGAKGYVPADHGIRFLKKTHADHADGPKRPEKWAWANLQLPAFKTAGVKTVRLLTFQKGFSVAYAMVSADREAPPKLSEAEQMASLRRALAADASASDRTAVGTILREVWSDMGGNSLSEMMNSARYQEVPSSTSHPTVFEAPQQVGETYGTRMRGYIHPPVTGDYVFWIAADDDGGLWLSTDEYPENKTRIAYHDGFVEYRGWESNPTQKSKPIRLRKGRRYYIEALHREGVGDDSVSVGWQLPDGTQERPIPGFRLSPYSAKASVPSFAVDITAPEDGAVVELGKSVSIQATLRGGKNILRVEAYRGGQRLGSMRGDPLKTTWRPSAEGTYPITVVALERGGRTAVSHPVNIRVGEEAFPYRAINLNGSSLSPDDFSWQSRKAANYKAQGWGLERQDLPLIPPAAPERARMIRSSISSQSGTRVALKRIPKGAYQVYLYVWEPEKPSVYDITVNDKVVLTGRKSGSPGSWARLGPWTIEVEEGRIDIAARRGEAHFSGIEIWKLGTPPPAPREPVRSDVIGGPGGEPFSEEPPDRPLVVGFHVTLGTYSGNPQAKTIQPIFMKDGARRTGQVRGDPGQNPAEILAKTGYAVGAVVGKGNERVNGFKVVFYRIAGNALDPSDQYESEWVGGNWGSPEKRLDGEGAPVVGIHGRSGGDTDCFGLIYLK